MAVMVLAMIVVLREQLQQWREGRDSLGKECACDPG